MAHPQRQRNTRHDGVGLVDYPPAECGPKLLPSRRPGTEQYSHILANPPGTEFWGGVVLEDLGLLMLLGFVERTVEYQRPRRRHIYRPARTGARCYARDLRALHRRDLGGRHRHSPSIAFGPQIGIGRNASQVK